jgi:hypothetical protein
MRNEQLKSVFMKKQLLILLLGLLLAQEATRAQFKKPGDRLPDRLTTEIQANYTELGRFVFVQNQLLVTNLRPEEFDRVAIVNMQGMVMQKQTVNGHAIRLDLTELEEGVHLLLLHSSTRMKEKSIKMYVKK